jgi:hypothetical protein
MKKLSILTDQFEGNGSLRMVSFTEKMGLLLSGAITTDGLRGNYSILTVFCIEN